MPYCIVDRFGLLGILNVKTVILHLRKKEKNNECVLCWKFPLLMYIKYYFVSSRIFMENQGKWIAFCLTYVCISCLKHRENVK